MPFDPASDQSRIDALPQNFKFDHEINHQDLNLVAASVGELAFDRLKSVSGKRDTQVATVAQGIATAYIQGIFAKKPLKTYWADGRYITLSDELPPGVDDIVYSTAGGRYTEENDGIYADDVSPEREVDIGVENTKQRFVTIKHKFTITQQDIWRSELTGMRKFEAKGAKTREAHLNALNKLIRVGNSKFKLHGVATHPGVRRRAALQNWSTGAAQDIYDEVVASIREMYDSPTDDDSPARLILPRGPMLQFNTAQKSTASDRVLRAILEEAFSMEQFMVLPDPGMKAASSLGGPAALFYTPTPDLVSVATPLFMHMIGPREVDAGVLEVQLWTRFAGVQVRDTDSILVVEGDGAGW